MSEERQRVLRMLKEGKVTVEEADALLEALEEAESGATPGEPAAGARTDSSRGEFQRLMDDITKAIDLDGIVESVRESLRRSKVDMERMRDEVLRATGRVREETRRAAEEYRYSGWGRAISRTIEGLWGLAHAAGAWAHETELGRGRRLEVLNIWGDVRLKASPDTRLRATAVIRAWGRDETEAAALRDAVRITAADAGQVLAFKVEPPAGELRRRFRVDFDVRVPAGVAVEIAQARGDVDAAGLNGDLVVAVASGDVSVRDQDGAVRVEAAKGDVGVTRASGDVRIKSNHGDADLSGIGGGTTVHLLHGDIEASDIKGAADLQTVHGDIHLDVGLLAAGSTSRAGTTSGDVAVRLGAGTRCRLAVRVTSGDIKAELPLIDVQRGPRSLEGVLVSPDAVLDLSTVSGDVVIEQAQVPAAPSADAEPQA